MCQETLSDPVCETHKPSTVRRAAESQDLPVLDSVRRVVPAVAGCFILALPGVGASRLKASVTLTLPDGRSCTTAPYRKGDAEICLIKDVAYGKYRVSITRAGQTVEVNLVVRTRGLFEVEGNCEVKEDGSGACDTD